MASFDLPDMPDARANSHLMMGAFSPLWSYFGAAAAGGVAYWWMTRWTQAENLEALLGAAAPPSRDVPSEAAEVLPAPTEIPEAAEVGAETVANVAETQAEAVEAAAETLAEAASAPADIAPERPAKTALEAEAEAEPAIRRARKAQPGPADEA